MAPLCSNTERIFLTGGTGFLGNHLRAELADRENEVTVFARPSTPVDLRDNESVQRGDITNEDDIALDGHDSVVHLAAQTHVETAIDAPRPTWEVNTTGTLNVLEASKRNDVSTFLFASSASVYGPPESLPITESHPTNPTEPYGASKLAGDRLAHSYHRTYGLPVVTARLFNTFGPGQSHEHVVPVIIRQALTSDTIELGNLSPSRDFLYVKDTVNALIKLLCDGTSGEAYNVGRGDDIEIGELAELVTTLIDRRLTIESVVERQRNENVEIRRHVADPSKIERLGWAPRYELRDGLEETIEAFKGVTGGSDESPTHGER